MPEPDWVAHKAPDGREYYYNSATKQTQWDKPEELKTAGDKGPVAGSAWKEFTTDAGKKYYYNSTTCVPHTNRAPTHNKLTRDRPLARRQEANHLDNA